MMPVQDLEPDLRILSGLRVEIAQDALQMVVLHPSWIAGCAAAAAAAAASGWMDAAAAAAAAAACRGAAAAAAAAATG
jgi:hypothetical protein